MSNFLGPDFNCFFPSNALLHTLEHYCSGAATLHLYGPDSAFFQKGATSSDALPVDFHKNLRISKKKIPHVPHLPRLLSQAYVCQELRQQAPRSRTRPEVLHVHVRHEHLLRVLGPCKPRCLPPLFRGLADTSLALLSSRTHVAECLVYSPNGSMRMHGRMNERMDGQVNGRVDGRINGRMDGRMNERMHGEVDGRIDGRMDRRMNDQMDGQVNGRINDNMDGSIYPRLARRLFSARLTPPSWTRSDNMFRRVDPNPSACISSPNATVHPNLPPAAAALPPSLCSARAGSNQATSCR